MIYEWIEYGYCTCVYIYDVLSWSELKYNVSYMWKFLNKVFFEVFTVTGFPQSFIRKSPHQTFPLYGIALLLCPPVVGFIWSLCMLHVVNQTCCGLVCYWLLPLYGRPSHIFSWYVSTLTVDPCSYRILQIVHGAKLSRFSWFLWQSRNFYS